ncbi:hypothetical protein WDU94_003673 [Cyamophila willieti]
MENISSHLLHGLSEELIIDMNKIKKEKLDSNIKDDTISPIQDFYKDQTVFITGATGFLGMLLVEKLLRCCSQIHKLILLVRNRGPKSINARVREYFSDPLFDTLRLANPKYYEKVNIVCGQLETENFGLCPTDLQHLISNTSLVFHVAATVRFDEHIRIAYNINVVGTNTMLSLAKQMTRLKSFVHVSTAYSHCDKLFIEETFYSPTFTANELSILTQNATDEQLSILNEHIIGKKPNTYTLTKATAEDLVREAVTELPICVFRPSVVFPTLEEPMALWMKGFNGVLALGLATGTGLYRAVLCQANIAIDFVPSDRTINAMVALAWYQTIPKTNKNTSQCTVSKENKQQCMTPEHNRQQCVLLNFVCAEDNRITTEKFMHLVHRDWSLSEEANKSIVWKSSYIITGNPSVHTILFYIFHFVPAIAFSLAERLTNQKPQVLKFYRKVKHFINIVAYFGLNEWEFKKNNVYSMIDAMSEEDQKIFDASMNNFSWQTMFRGSLHRSIGLYILGDRFTKEDYKKRMVYRVWAHNVLMLLLKVLSVYFIIYFVAQLINNFFIF